MCLTKFVTWVKNLFHFFFILFSKTCFINEVMKIYTKGGDTGETGLFGGSRVPKDDLRIRTYGTLDELNAVIGLAITEITDGNEVKSQLLRIQGELFQLGAELATPRGKSAGIELIHDQHVEMLEKEIDAMEEGLTPLKTFILPGGTKAASWVHFARTVSRRAERELISLNRAEPSRPSVLQYVNRLSDYFFVTARYLNHQFQVADVPWHMRPAGASQK
jgi:cob(I)alamin adenosyltransferase